MAGMPVWVSVEGAGKMKALSKRLKDNAKGGDLKRAMRKEIKDAGKPIIAELKTAALATDVTVVETPSSGSPNRRVGDFRSTGLRRAVAKATTMSVTNSGVRFKVSSKRVARTHFPTAAKYLDGSVGKYGRWRHPVFGDMDSWVQQTGDPYFFKTITRHRKSFRKAVFRAMENTADELANASDFDKGNL